MKKKVKLQKRIKILMIFYFAFASLFLFNVTFSKFISKTNGDTSVNVAKFAFVLKNNDNNLSDNFEYNLASHITGGMDLALTDNVVPGQNGSIDLVIDLTGTEVSAKWAIYVNPKQTIPENLKFYSDENFLNELSLGGTSILSEINYLSDEKVINKSVYWKWDFDESITENEYEKTDLLFDIRVVVRQYVGGE